MAKKNMRVLVMQKLKNVGKRYRFLTGSQRWGQRQQVYGGGSQIAGGPAWRRRLPEEMIENDLGAWRELRVELRAMVDDLIALDEVALREIGRIRKQQEVDRHALN